MNYLIQFLTVLKENEIEKLKQIQLIGKEKKLLEILIEYKNKNLPKEIILEKLQLSENHFYKACSVLLDKCYQFMFENNVFKILKFLSKRDLYQNLKHEIFQQEKNYSNDLAFNLLAFELLQRGSYKNHEENIIQYFANQILNIVKSNEKEYEKFNYYVEVRRIRSKMFELAALQNSLEAEKYKNRLLELSNQMDKSQHSLAFFHLYHGLYNYHIFFDKQLENSHNLLINALEACKNEKELLDLEDLSITKLKIAENLYYHSNFLESYHLYEEIQEEYPEIFYEDFYHLTKYVQLLLILEKWEKAEEILKNHFLNYLKVLHPTRGTMAAINYTKLFLLQKDFKEANYALQKARFLNDKNFYLPYEFEIRLLESTLYFFTEDTNFFLTTLKKQYKYLKSKGLKLWESNYVNYLRFLEEVYKYKKKNQKFKWKEKFQSIYNTFQESSYKVYGKLLTLCLQKDE